MLLERDARIGHLEDVVESHKAANATAKAEIEQLELRLEELEADEGAAARRESPADLP